MADNGVTAQASGMPIAAATARVLQSRTSRVSNQSQCSFVFDVSSKRHISIVAISFIAGAPEGEYDIWYAKEGHEHVHQCQKAWELVGNATHPGQRGYPCRIELKQAVNIPSGQTHAFYIAGHSSNAVYFSTDHQGNNSAENGDLQIHLGHFKSYLWESQLSTGPFGHNGMQGFVGSLEYHVIQSEAADHIATAAWQLWERRPFSDATVVANNGKTFEVHRSVLAASSPVFEAAWRQPLRESEDRALHVDAAPEAVESLLCFVYTGSPTDSTQPGEMLRLAHLYELPALVRMSATQLAMEVSPATAVSSVRALRPYRDDTAVSGSWHQLMVNIQAMLAGDTQLLEEVMLNI